MDPNAQQNLEYPGQQDAQRAYTMQIWKDRIYRLFYNIWPAVYAVIAGVSYHTFRIIRGGVRIAMEQFKHGG